MSKHLKAMVGSTWNGIRLGSETGVSRNMKNVGYEKAEFSHKSKWNFKGSI